MQLACAFVSRDACVGALQMMPALRRDYLALCLQVNRLRKHAILVLLSACVSLMLFIWASLVFRQT